MSKQSKRYEAIRKFVVANYSEICATSFDKTGFKRKKEAYFGTLLRYQFQLPKDEEICDVLIKHIIRKEHINFELALQQRLDVIPFTQSVHPNLTNYNDLIDQCQRNSCLSADLKGMSDIDKIDALKRVHIDGKVVELEREMKQKEAELDASIRIKEAEYRKLPSILDDNDFDEPADKPTTLASQEWWQELNLRSNPFPGPLEGFHMVDKALYDAIAIETEPIKWMRQRISGAHFDFFHKGYLVCGEFGAGKTTFIDYISPHLAICHIETIILPIIENISVAQYIQAFQKQFSFKICQLARKYNISTTGRIVDFIEAQLIMMDLQAQHDVRGFLIFIDDLHKHSQRDLVFLFLANLQMVKSNLSREGIDVSFFVSGLPSWRDRIKQDTALTGFFDASETLELPPVTPDIAALAIRKRLQAFSENPEKDIQIKLEFFQSIFRRVVTDRGGSNIGFRPYIQEAQKLLNAKQFDILTVDFTTLDETLLALIRNQLETCEPFKESINQLIFGGKIEKQTIRAKTLKILCEVYIRKGVAEDEQLFVENQFSFKRLQACNLIQKANRKGKLVWKIHQFVDKLNKEILAERGYSIEDYIVQLYAGGSLKTHKPQPPQSIKNKYAEELSELAVFIDKNINDSLQAVLQTYEELLLPYIGSNSIPIPEISFEALDRIDGCIWSLMKCILRFESPALLDIYGEQNPTGWGMRHRALEGPQQFFNLQRIRKMAVASKTDIARKITFANEAFEELWSELKIVVSVSINANVKAYQLPQKTLKCIYNEHANLFSFSVDKEVFYKSFESTVKCLEESVRNYLHVASLLQLGPYYIRIGYYPPDIRKYITTNLQQSVSYETYNEFEEMNRGQYRTLFTQTDKKSIFFRAIIQPLISTWDSRDLDVFFNLFGDMNIVVSHIKKMSALEMKQDIPTFFRLGCRLQSAMSHRLLSLITFENTIASVCGKTTIVFGFRHKNTDTSAPIFKTDISQDFPKELFRNDISNAIDNGYQGRILQVSDNDLGESVANCMDIDDVRVKYGMEYVEAMSCIAYSISMNEIRGIVHYGDSLYLRKLKIPTVL